MPAIQTEPRLRIRMSVWPDDLRQPGVRRGKFRVMRLPVRPLGVEIIRAAEIILRAGAADGRKLRITVQIEFDFTFAPPAGVMHAPSEIGADILALAFHAVEDGVKALGLHR